MNKDIKDDLKLNETEKKVYDKISLGIKAIEDKLVKKLVSGKYSLLLGERELLESFIHYLDDNGINTRKDVGYVMMGMSDEESQPVMVMKVNSNTGEIKPFQVCMIKKSDVLISMVDSGLRENKGCNKGCKEGHNKFDINKLITIEVEQMNNGRSIYSRFLDKKDELSEENVRKITGHIFNTERTLKNVITNARKEYENQKIMYG